MSSKASSQIFRLPDVRLFDSEKPLQQGRRLTLIKRQSGNATARRVILFVHGLKSSANTWTPFVRAAYENTALNDYDFATFEYQTSLLGRLRFPFRKVNAVDWSHILADTLQHTMLATEGYEQIVLVGHSMGGLVAKLAIKDLYEEQDETTLRRIHSLFTYATPHFGSDRALKTLSLVSHDVAFLRENSEPITKLSAFWEEHAGPARDLDIPLRAVLSASDEVVAKDSGSGGLQQSDLFHVGTSHTQIHCPTDSGDRRISWFCEQLTVIDKAPNVRLLAIRNVPPGELLDPRHPGFPDGMMDLVFVLGVGHKDGVAEGDEFQLLYDEKSKHESEITTDPFASPPWHLLKATRVENDSTVAVMRTFVYGAAIDRLQEAKEKLGLDKDAAPEDSFTQQLVDHMFGTRARRIDSEETQAILYLDDAKKRAIREEPGSPSWERSVLDVMDRSEEFIHRYPDSPHTESAMFDRAFATKQLGRWTEASRRFGRFVERFPLSVSAPGARDHLEEIGHREALRSDPANPHLALRLARYLMSRTNFADGVPLMRDVLVQYPDKLSEVEPLCRLDLFASIVVTDLMGRHIASIYDLPDWLQQYCNTPNWIEEASARIAEVTDEPLRELLLKIHANVPTDFLTASERGDFDR